MPILLNNKMRFTDKTNRRGDSVKALAKALNISVELLVLEEGQNHEQLKSLEYILSKIAQAETQKLLGEAKTDLEKELILFIKSDKVPQKDKDIILARIKRLLERYNKRK